MTRLLRLLALPIGFLLVAAASVSLVAQPRPLRIIAFGAHPDDAELKAAGVAALWAAKGHKVKFVAMTNGDVGHFSQAGGPLAQRRYKEVQECARILGITRGKIRDRIAAFGISVGRSVSIDPPA